VKYARTPSGATSSACPWRRSIPPGRQQAAIASGSRAATAAKYLRATASVALASALVADPIALSSLGRRPAAARCATGPTASLPRRDALIVTCRRAGDGRARVHALPGGRDAALALSARLDELAARQRAALSRELPEWTVQRPDLRAPQEAAVRGGLRDELETLRAGAPLPDELPPWDRELVRLAVGVAAPLGSLITGYRTASALLLDAWMEEVERLGLDAAQRLVLLADPQADAGGLGHDLGGHHVALVAWGDDAAAAVGELARRLDRAPLLVEQAERTWWAWLSGPRPLGEAPLREALAGWRPPLGVRVALGGEQPGREGFRGSHREARDAHRVAVRRGEPVTRYADVALEVLASADEGAARRCACAGIWSVEAPRAATTEPPTGPERLARRRVHGRRTGRRRAPIRWAVHVRTGAQAGAGPRRARAVGSVAAAPAAAVARRAPLQRLGDQSR
jgi:hypothetical protein